MQVAPSSPGACAEAIATVATGRDFDRPVVVLTVVILALAAVRAFVAASAGLTDDEAYYRLWSLAPAMSYLDHPPMVAWMIAGGRWLAGDTPLGIRLPAVLGSLIGPFILWRTASNLMGDDLARYAVWIMLAMPLMAVGGVIMTPDIPSVLFWGLAAWALSELHVSRNANWWLAIGLFAGLGLISKYTNLFLGASILLWLIWLPGNLRWFKTWQLWIGGAIAALTTTPVLLWNLEHDWASFIKQFGRAGRGQELTLNYLLELVGAFFGLASPFIAALALCGLALIVRSALKRRDPAHIMIAALVLPLTAYLLLHALHSRVQGNWPAPLYPVLAVAAAFAVKSTESLWLRRLGAVGIATGFLFSAVIYAHAVAPLSLMRNMKDPTSQMRGWQQFALDINNLRQQYGACRIVTSSYTTTAQLAYHLKGRAPVVQLKEPLRYVHLPPIVSDPTCPALYVELERRQEKGSLEERFAEVKLLGRVDRAYAGAPLAGYTTSLVTSPFRP